MVMFSDGDWFALAMLGFMLLSFGVLLSLGFSMLRNSSRRDGEVDKLIDEVTAAEKTEIPAQATSLKPQLEPWEKESDWWKKS